MKKILLLPCLTLALSGFAQMTTAGSAVQLGGCSCYQLNPNQANVRGAIWSPSTVSLLSDFDMTFQVYVGAEDVWGADGMTFVLQENPNGLGDFGHSIGYESFGGNPNPISAQSIAIELDTWNSSPTVATDIPDDHIGISSNGVLEHDLVGPTVFPGNQNIEDGAYHTFRVQWLSGFQILNVYWDGNAIPLITLNNDLVTNIFGGTSDLYWGFTSSTGGVFNEHRVCVTSTASFSVDQSSVCPGTSIQFTDASSSNTGIINSWSWDFGDGNSSAVQNPSHSYNAPGNYNAVLTMTDGFGCQYTDNVSITILDSITMNMTATDVTCFGDVDGAVTSNPTNGTGPYSYLWNDTGTQNTQSASNLPPGWYTVEVTDNLGCVGYDSVEVQEPLEMILTMDSTNAHCPGNSDGTVTATPTNGTSPYNYLWDDTGAQTTQTATGLPLGTYNVLVTDDNGCTATGSIDVGEDPAITLIMDSTNSSCNGGADGTATATPVNGNSPFNYTWNDSGTQSTQTATGLVAGMYTVVVADVYGCTAEDSIEVVEQAGLTVEMDSVMTTCYGGSDGAASVNVVSGTGPYTYLWNDGATSTTDSISGLTAGIYTVVVTDGNGCSVTDSASVDQPAAIIATASGTDVACYGGNTGEVTVTVSNGVAPLSYQWNDASNQTTQTATGLAMGTYTVIVTDNNGCTANSSVTISENAEITATSTSTDDSGAGDGSIDLTVSGGITPYTYVWSNGATTEDLSSVVTGEYDVIITDAVGCQFTLTDSVGLILELELPSAMSPNADGYNDYFHVKGIEGFPQNKLVVTNRWGNIVYQTENYTNDWYGLNMNGEELPEGVYFVTLEIDGGEQHSTYLELRRN
ncbi:gliding motility-associated C-terminal domain-containing protein [Paracrocinitomix mangrovi]|uniref:lectin-like domain-containing protein n=1 Tax=Paracrocinitomix mangrovi TaxID=2862509 RepID=UPI001C8DD9E9|nr:gliding motility-associated C-terminal domain-containing protein [Paracrocinitomix mangrovi]UKN03057.1 gliding motility-associated C-terminal domain-containing protein [Paracrocinitomix mangrovi]